MRSKILIFISFVIFIIIWGLSLSKFWYTQTQKSEKYNIILISIDTLRPDHMSMYGYSKNTTPNIDKWSKSALVFTNMRTTVPATYPSFVTFMTGKDQFETEIYNNLGDYNGRIREGGYRLPQTFDTFAELAQKRGYKTAAFLTNSVLDADLTNINQGFDEYSILAPFAEDEKKYESVTDTVSKWVKDNKDKSFFLWVHLTAPHAPYEPPLKYACSFDKRYCDEIQTKGLQKLEEERKLFQFCQDKELPQNIIGKFNALYDGEISWDDEQVGKLLKILEKNNLNENSIVVFYGDHGEGFDHNYYFGHSSVIYDSALRIPFIIKDPRLKAKVFNENLANKDGFYLLQKLLQNEVADDTTFLNAINELDTKNREIFFSNTELSKFALLRNNYKYIYSNAQSCLNGGYTKELYDIKNDPQERKNLVIKNRKTANEMETTLLNYIKLHSITHPIEQVTDDEIQQYSKRENEIIDKLRSLGY